MRPDLIAIEKKYWMPTLDGTKMHLQRRFEEKKKYIYIVCHIREARCTSRLNKIFWNWKQIKIIIHPFFDLLRKLNITQILRFSCCKFGETLPMRPSYIWETKSKLKIQLEIKFRPFLKWNIFGGFWCCSTYEDLPIHVSIAIERLILTMLRWFLFTGYIQEICQNLIYSLANCRRKNKKNFPVPML